MRKTKIICTLGPSTDKGECFGAVNALWYERCPS